MRIVLAIVLVAHGLIHVLGVAKSFGSPNSRSCRLSLQFFGFLWLTAALLFCAAGVALFMWPRGWWAIGTCAVVISAVVVAAAWTDAKFGVLGNLFAVVAVFFGFMTQGPMSLRAAYDKDVERGLAQLEPTAPISEADLERLPDPVKRYLRIAGVVGQPRVRNFHVRMHGRIRSGPEARWIPFNAEQYSFVDERARFFYLTGSMFTIPVQGYHRYASSSASMRVKAAAIVPVVEASGNELHQAETVTMFNDMCLMAPATLIDPAIVWEAVDAHTARATLRAAGTASMPSSRSTTQES